MLHSICQQTWSVFIPIPKKGSVKECSNYHIIVHISHAGKVMLKNLQARLRQYFNWELPGVQAGFRKGCETRYQIANIRWIIEKTREFPKTCTSASLTRLEPLTVWNTTNSGKLLKRCEYQTTLPTSWETCMRVKKQQLEPCMEQLIGSRLRKEYDRDVYCHPLCFIYIMSTSWETPGWTSYKLESR